MFGCLSGSGARGKSAAWNSLEAGFRTFVTQQIAAQKDAITVRLAARMQDRDRRQNLTTAMEKARQAIDADWGDGVAWCDAKRVLSSARQFLQQRGIAAQALSHKNIIDEMTDVPGDVSKLVKVLKSLAKPDALVTSRKGRKPKRPS